MPALAKASAIAPLCGAGVGGAGLDVSAGGSSKPRRFANSRRLLKSSAPAEFHFGLTF
jgi:hypothetical protein